MKAAELANLEHDELADRLRSSRRELYELRFKLAVGQLDDHRQIRKVRKDIARILSTLRQRELVGAGVMPVQAEAPSRSPQPEQEEEEETEAETEVEESEA